VQPNRFDAGFIAIARGLRLSGSQCPREPTSASGWAI